MTDLDLMLRERTAVLNNLKIKRAEIKELEKRLEHWDTNIKEYYDNKQPSLL